MTRQLPMMAISLMATLVGCGKGGGQSDSAKPKTVADALKLVDLGQCEAAATKLREYTSTTPDSFDGVLALGDALTCMCFDPSVKTPRGPVHPERCAEAVGAYESAILLRKDSAARVSLGALKLVLDDKDAAAASLESADGAAAANLLALASLSRDADRARSALERHYAGRKPSAVTPPSLAELCGTSLDCRAAM